ncbi:MAG: hypothetical protein QOH54_6237, partial [Mycobacterium sp.]|nr:hypothetical protein [Mycobacterium sp.]
MIAVYVLGAIAAVEAVAIVGLWSRL